MNRRLAALLVFLSAGLCFAEGSDRTVLVDVTKSPTTDHLDSTSRLDGQWLLVHTGLNNPYPNIRFAPPEGAWDLSTRTQIEVAVKNLSNESLKIGCRVDNPGATGQKNSATGSVTLDPGAEGVIVIPFARDIGADVRAKLFHMRSMPYVGRRHVLDPSRIVSINIFLNRPTREYDFAVGGVRATGVYDAEADEARALPADKFFPFVDRYGQYIHDDWPGKTKSDEDLTKDRQAEAKDLAEKPQPTDWDEYGGWASGPTLEAKGHFYTAKHGGKWWLVTPKGHLFFSIGVAAIKAGGSTPIQDRDGWFADLPAEDDPVYKDLYATGRGRDYYKNQMVKTFSFYGWNMLRKYGPKWEETFFEMTPKRLRSWGFNTLGCWAEPKLERSGTMPYTTWVFYQAPRIRGAAGWKPFPDMFDPKFTDNLRRRIANTTRFSRDDPMCIGYFVDNELFWSGETALAEAALASANDQPAKQALVAALREKYGDVAKLNAAWGTSFADWDALAPTKGKANTAAAEADLRAFNERAARKYFQTVRDLLKEFCPNKLYLGCRFAQCNAQVVRIAAEFCDVLSFNLYRQSIAAWKPAGDVDKPVIVGEFHFGATDRGHFGGGLIEVPDQAARAAAYRRYVTGALENPSIVGTHWFQFRDEPVAGRVLEGENYQIGLVTVTDRPYPELIEAARAVAATMYGVRSGAAPSPPADK